MRRLMFFLVALGLLSGFALGEKLKQVKEQQCDHYRMGEKPLCVIVRRVEQ